MGHVYDAFERELDDWRRQYAGRPREEMVRLFLLALEREELVAIGYREALIVERLNTMPLEAEVRALIRHALLWAWKDEEMHAIYIRGAILKMGRPFLKTQAFLQQLAGAIGGWAGSVRQHVRWSRAPISRALATLITWAGVVAGRVPREVRAHLQLGPFRDFCLFNVDAEKTAHVCWKRLAELAQDQPDLPATVADDFRRIRDDEERHQRIFEILAAALDEQDRLVTGETADSLAHKIGTVGQFFLPRERRRSQRENPLGSGGSVWIVRGKTGPEKRPLFRWLLGDAGLPEHLAARARALARPVADLHVVIKPTFMYGYHRKDRSPITDPDLLEELALYLRAQGCQDVAVVEARNIYDQFYQNRTVHAVARYFQLHCPHARLVDLSEEQVKHCYARGLAEYSVARTWKEADFRITFGKMRSPPVVLVHLTIKNLEGLGTRCEEFVFTDRLAQRQTPIMMLLDEFPPHFAVLDAYDSAADGLLGMMGCPRPPVPRRLYAGADALAVDLVAARHLGVQDPRESSVLRAACHWFGDPSEQIDVIGPDEPVAGWRGPYHTELSTLLSFLAYPVYQLGSGRGALFVPEMDTKAFPPVGREGLLLQIGRRAIQALLGLRHPRRSRRQPDSEAQAPP